MAKNEQTSAPEKKSKGSGKEKKAGFFSRVGKWFHDLKSECKKIVWPTRKQTTNNSLIVIATILVIGVFIWILDAVFNFGITALIAAVA